MPSVSAKQAKLMSAIKHGWHPPAGMHAPSMAVAKEFHSADKKAGKYMHAKGGKVTNVSDAIKVITVNAFGRPKQIPVLHTPATPQDFQRYRTLLEDYYPGTRSFKTIENEVGDNKRSVVFPASAAWHEHVMPHVSGWLGSDMTGSELGWGDIQNILKGKQGSDKVFFTGMYGGLGGMLTDLARVNPEQYAKIKANPSLLAKDANEAAEIAAHQPPSPEKFAEGGQVDITDPQVQRDLLRSRATPMPSKSERFLSLISHAADRATATVTDDPHHALARVASGLASQVAGQAPSGRVEFGRRPNLVNEAKSLPAGLADVGMAGSNILGGLSDKYLPQTPGTIGYMLSKLRDAANAYTDKNGDPAPAWSRKAGEDASRMHQATNQAMNLSAPHGFTENAADALGTMLGQLPIPGTQAKVAAKGLKGGLSAMGRAIPEYLGPTIRPSTRNYLTGALGGGALGTLASMGDDSGPPPQVAETHGMLKEKYE